MRYQPTADDFDYTPSNAAGSVEPMRKADHKSKKHPRPMPSSRKEERIGGGHFVFKRGSHGRIHPNPWPFEHASAESASTEAERLRDLTGEPFEVYSRVAKFEAAVQETA